MANEYWKKTLSGRGVVAYQRILNAARSFERDVAIGEIGQAEINKIFAAVLDDHPELFYVAPEYFLTGHKTFFSDSYEMQLDFLWNRFSVFKYNEAIEKAKRELHPKIVSLKKDEEREKVICEYFIDNFTYSVDNRYNQNAGTVFHDKIGQCSGFARALKLLFDWAKIECIVVSGTLKANRKRESHAWNIVKIDGKYYNLDVTAMIGSNQKGKKPYFYCIYNFADSQMTDYVWDRSKTPPCTTETPVTPPVNSTPVPPPTLPNTQYQQQMPNTTYNATPIPLPNSTYQPAPSLPSTPYNQSIPNSTYNTPVPPLPNTPHNLPMPQQNDAGLKVVKSMAEFRIYFEDELKKGKRQVSFVSEIFASDTNALIRSITSSNQLVCQKLGISGQVRLSISGKVITLELIS